MTVKTMYSRPLKCVQEKQKDKKYSQWKGLNYTIGDGGEEYEYTGGFSSSYLTESGVGNLSESYIPRKAEYGTVHLNGNDKEGSYAPVLHYSNFQLHIPSNVHITKVGFIIRCYVDNKKSKVYSPSVTVRGASLDSKDLHNEFLDGMGNFTGNGKEDYKATRLVGYDSVQYSPVNLTYEWSALDVDFVTPEQFNNHDFGFRINFRNNHSSTPCNLKVDYFAVYVEYETSDYEVINGTELSGHLALGDEVTHTMKLTHESGEAVEPVITQVRIPKCFRFDEVNGYTCSNGELVRSENYDYDGLYNTKLKVVPTLTEKNEYKLDNIIEAQVYDEWTPNMTGEPTNPFCMRKGTFFQVRLTDGNDEPLAGKIVTFKTENQVYQKKTNFGGVASLLITYWEGRHTIEYSFTDPVFKDCYGKTLVDVINDPMNSYPVKVTCLDGKGTYESPFTIAQDTALSVQVKDGMYKQVLSHARVKYTITDTSNTKSTKTYYKYTNNEGIAHLNIHLTKDSTWKVEYSFEPANTDYLYGLFDKSETQTTYMKITGDTKYTIRLHDDDTTKGDTETNRLTVNRFDSLFVQCLNGYQGMDNEYVTFVLPDYNENEVPDYTNSDGVAGYSLNIPSGDYKVEVKWYGLTDKDNTETKVTKTFYITVVDPPVDYYYNYLWIVPDGEDSTLTLNLQACRIGNCSIEAYNNVSGNVPSYVYVVDTYPLGTGVWLLTPYIYRNTDNQYLDLLIKGRTRSTDIYNFKGTNGSYTWQGNTRKIIDEIRFKDFTELNESLDMTEVPVYSDTDYELRFTPERYDTDYIAMVRIPIYTHSFNGSKYTLTLDRNEKNTPISVDGDGNPLTFHILEKIPTWVTLNTPVTTKFSRISRQLSTDNEGTYVLSCSGGRETRFNHKTQLSTIVDVPFIFIGMVRLYRSHMNPVGSTTQTLLDRQYKERVILKKKGDYEDKVETTIRTTPQKLATIKELCKLDMPTPVHLANVEAWNPLTVHGWVELYATSNEKEINSKIYEAKVEWRYLTKELWSLMTINRDKNRVYTGTGKTSFVRTHYFNDPILDFFNFDGAGLITDIDDEEYAECIVNPHEEQYYYSKTALPSKCRLTMNWKDILHGKDNDELDYFLRGFRLLREDKETNILYPVYEYRYDGFTHFLEDNDYPIDTIINEINVNSIVYDENGDIKDNTSRTVTVDYDDEYYTDNENITVYTDENGDYNYYVGSTVVFSLNGDTLNVQDTGASGNEYQSDDIKLVDGEYYLEYSLCNHAGEENATVIDNVWDSFFNLQVEEDKTNKDYNVMYNDTVVSPAPIVNGASLKYTRLGEDGLIYYYDYVDGKTYKYQGNPYYPYKNGTDLRTVDGMSVFNTNNDFSPLCLANGLVMVALHRYSGFVEFYRWSNRKQDYIECYGFWLDMDNHHITVDKYTDDYIQVSWGGTTWRIWRGRPYIEVSHPKVDFHMNDMVTRIYGDTGSGVMSSYDIDYNKNALSNFNNEDLNISNVDYRVCDVTDYTTSITLDEYEINDVSKIKSDEVKNITGNITYTKGSKTGNPIPKDCVVYLQKYNSETREWVTVNRTVTHYDDTTSSNSFSFTIKGVGEQLDTNLKYRVWYKGSLQYMESYSKEFTVEVEDSGKKEVSIDFTDTDGINWDYSKTGPFTVTATMFSDKSFTKARVSSDKFKVFFDNTDITSKGTITADIDSEDMSKVNITYKTTDNPLKDLGESKELVGDHYLHFVYDGDDHHYSHDTSTRLHVKDKLIIPLSVIYDENTMFTTFTVTPTDSDGMIVDLLSFHVSIVDSEDNVIVDEDTVSSITGFSFESNVVHNTEDFIVTVIYTDDDKYYLSDDDGEYTSNGVTFIYNSGKTEYYIVRLGE